MSRVPAPAVESIAEFPNAPSAGRITNGTTYGGRLDLIDDLVEHLVRREFSARNPTVVDLGIGCPPVTTIHLAQRLNGAASVIGADLHIPNYYVRFPKDKQFDYVVFVEVEPSTGEHRVTLVRLLNVERLAGGRFSYEVVPTSHWQEIKTQAAEIAETLLRDEKLAFSLNGQLSSGGSSLVLEPVRRYEREVAGLRFIKCGFDLTGVRPVEVIRVINVFWYYSAEEIATALNLMADKLVQGGVLLAGRDSTFLAYHKLNGRLYPIAYFCRLKLTHIKGTQARPTLFEDPSWLWGLPDDEGQRYPAFSSMFHDLELVLQITIRQSADLKQLYECTTLGSRERGVLLTSMFIRLQSNLRELGYIARSFSPQLFFIDLRRSNI